MDTGPLKHNIARISQLTGSLDVDAALEARLLSNDLGNIMNYMGEAKAQAEAAELELDSGGGGTDPGPGPGMGSGPALELPATMSRATLQFPVGQHNPNAPEKYTSIHPRWASVPDLVFGIIERAPLEDLDVADYATVLPDPGQQFLVRSGQRIHIPRGFMGRSMITVQAGGRLFMEGSVHADGYFYGIQADRGSYVNIRGGAFSGACSANLYIADGVVERVLCEETGGDGIKINNDGALRLNGVYVRRVGLEGPNFQGKRASDMHADSVQGVGGTGPLFAEFSVFDCLQEPALSASSLGAQAWGNSAFMLKSSWGGLDDLTLRSCLLIGGNFSVYYLTDPKTSYGVNRTVFENTYYAGPQYGPLSTHGATIGSLARIQLEA